jgi:arsenate reductase (thioredoxin)
MVNPPTNVLFVCIGNACRSQMAEAFARAYGQGVIEPASAGLFPASAIPAATFEAMAAKHLDMRDQFPKSLRQFGKSQFDLVINMSGAPLPEPLDAEVRSWYVPDPVSMPFEGHCAVRDHIERLVMGLILELRNPAPSLKGQSGAGST